MQKIGSPKFCNLLRDEENFLYPFRKKPLSDIANAGL